MRQPFMALGLVSLVAALAVVAAGQPSARGVPNELSYRLMVPGLAKDPPEVAPTQSPTPSPTPDPGTPAPTPDAPNSYDLIDEALAKLQITAEEAVIYRVYASYADPRLPAAYRADGELPDSVDLFADFDTLSASAKALLAPFRLRPDHPDSWWYATDAGALTASAGEVSAAARPAGPWLNVTGAKVRVHYPAGSPALAGTAASIVSEAENVIWPKLTGLMGREPLPDCLLICGDFGGSSRYDIYLVTVVGARVRAESPNDCRGPWTTFMELNPAKSFATLAHELMHSFVRAFPRAGGCDEYRWLNEATAQWAEDYIYKKTYNSTDEHFVLADFLDHPRQPLESVLENHEYGAYIFLFYLTRVAGVAESVVKDIWSAATNSDSLKAIDGALPGGFAKHWPEFVKYNWNPDPGWAPLDQYRTLDDITFRAARQSGFSPKAVSASPDQQVPLTNPELVHLSSAYYEFTFDGSVSTLAFLNGFTYELKIENIDGAQVFTSTELDGTEPVKKYGKVHALIKRQGKDWEVADWSKTPSSIMCLDDPNDRVERLVIILSNSDHDRANLPIKPVGSLGPRLWASNIGCWKWQGTATWVNPTSTQSTTANVTWERVPNGGGPGVIAAAVGDRYGVVAISYRPIGGTITFRASGNDGGCTYSGGATFDFANLPPTTNFLVTNNFVPAGDFHRVYVGGGLTPPVTMTQACPAVSLSTAPRIWLLAVDDRQVPLKFSADGRHMTGTADAEGDVFTWDFTAIRGP